VGLGPLRPTRTVRVAIFSVAVCAAAGLVGGAFSLLPRRLDVRTDIVGYPTVYNFNSERYLWAYAAIAGAFPLVTAVLYLVLRQTIAPGPAESLGLIELLERRAAPDEGEAARTATAVARVLCVGLALGLEAAICLDQNSIPVIPLTILVGLVYGVLAATGAVLLARRIRGWTGYELLGAINALAAPVTVLGLGWVSAVTKVAVASDNRVHHYPWFSWWLAAAVAVALWAWIIRALRRTRPGAALARVERRALLAVVAPVVLFLFLASLPGAPGDIDSFHEGEQLAAAHLIQAGRFPWRDLLFIHGLLGDVAEPLVGLSVFGDTRWGNLAGQSMFVVPASWLGLYLLCAYLFRDNWLFLLGTQLAVVTGWVFALQTRFVLVPFVVLLLAALLRKATWPRAIAFMSVLAVHTIATPEGSYAVPAYLLAVVCFDLAGADRRQSVTRRLRRTTMCGLTGLVVVALWFGFLAVEHAAGDFVFYYRTFAPGHELTGALPIAIGIGGAGTQWGGDWYYRFAAAAPIALVLLTVWYFVARARSARSIPVDDWVMGATAVFLGLYYVKFLDRSDHVYQPFALAIPVLFYVLYRIVSAVEAVRLTSRPPWLPTRHWVTLPLVGLILVASPKNLDKIVDSVSYRFAASAVAEPPLARVGYVLNTDPLFHSVFEAPPKTIDASLIGDTRTIMHAYLRPGDRLFDLSNNPALFWYLLRLPLATRYFHVSMAIRQHTQHDLIAELRRERPRLVVFSSDWIGLPYWDGIPNEVRHYDVSRYVLDHYRPLLWSHGLLLLVRKGEHPPPVAKVAPRLVERPQTTNLYFRTFSCDWGYAPDFLSVRPPSEQGLTMSSHRRSPGIIALQRPAGADSRYGWLEVDSTSTFGATRFVLTDRLTSADNRRQVAFTTRGGTSVIRVQVGSCSQWHGYRGHTLYLGTDPTQGIRAVRLLP
jgi:hypothetical protein